MPKKKLKDLKHLKDNVVKLQKKRKKWQKSN